MVVATSLFADCPESTARRRLNTAVWRLQTEVRARTGVDLIGRPASGTVGLNQGVEMTIDVVLFENLLMPLLRSSADDLTAQDVALLEDAIALHRGCLVEQCNDEWILSARYRLETLYLTALDYLIQHYGGQGDVVAVSRYGELALAVEPLREDIHRHLMAAYGASGRRDLVERQFEQCRMLLLAELGTDPMPETLALYGRLTLGEGQQPVSVAVLVSELQRARREVSRLGELIDRSLDLLHRMP
ncbi:AfsR/SARP family transcriptional regulator [Kocuria sabuli]|uniref:AfsR/SARP family transcriptional regulator n=1 Tax=Kocuria sabuli TaxID=3071448 RepID=UPI0034D67F4E